jgi:O-methyltransferase
MEIYELVSDIDEAPTRRRENYPEIVAEEFWTAYAEASRYSLLHVGGFYNLYQSIHYILDNELTGAFVECGCALGGAAIFMARVLRQCAARRPIYLFDTFVGPPIGTEDFLLGQRFIWTGGMPEHRAATERNIEDALPTVDTGDISLLRLDTDFYDSTLAEFTHLYPKLVSGGVIIVDDYGIFAGSRRATDEYLARIKPRPLLNKVDMYVWAGVKP